jgi:hypothetical protein
MTLLFAAVLAAAQISAADQQALHDYDLTAAKIDKLMTVGTKMREYAAAHPEVRQQGDFMRGKDLGESIKSVEAKPELVAMMKEQGVTPRDFVLGTMSLFSAAMWAQMSKQYPDAKMPPEINPNNVKLLQDHPEVMQKWEQAWSEKGRSRGQ